jgi:hypothetical protein
MKVRTLVIAPAAVLALGAMSGTASAHPVGTHGMPSCFGERISHGSSDHNLTPKERAARLQAFVDAGDELAVELFGPTVTVREMTAFVRVNCSDNPILLPFL